MKGLVHVKTVLDANHFIWVALSVDVFLDGQALLAMSTSVVFWFYCIFSIKNNETDVVFRRLCL